MNIVKSAQLVNIRSNGLQYRGTNDNLFTISFEKCRQNHLHHWQSQESDLFDVTANRCIGERNILAKPPYIDFYTEPITRLEFRFSLLRCQRPMRCYHQVRQKLRDGGWT